MALAAVLAVVLHFFARKWVGWAMAPDMHTSSVCAALQLALVQRQPDAGLIEPRVANSNRGNPYASAVHQALLTQHGWVDRMSRKVNGWRDGVVGAVNGSSR